MFYVHQPEAAQNLEVFLALPNFGTCRHHVSRAILRSFDRSQIYSMGKWLCAICSTNTLITPQTAWHHRCDSLSSVEVILHGRPFYHSNKKNPSVACFSFGRQPGRRTEYYKYGMTQDDNDPTGTIWHLRRMSVTIPPDLDPVYHPLAQDLSYRFDNHSVAATCTTNSSSAVTIPCMEGSFDNSEDALNLTIMDLRTRNVTKLRARDKGVWAPVEADDAPSVLLIDDSLGSEVLRTAVTMPGNCTRLKLCLATRRERGIDVLAAVGLILKAQDNYAYTCTTPDSN